MVFLQHYHCISVGALDKVHTYNFLCWSMLLSILAKVACMYVQIPKSIVDDWSIECYE